MFLFPHHQHGPKGEQNPQLSVCFLCTISSRKQQLADEQASQVMIYLCLRNFLWTCFSLNAVKACSRLSDFMYAAFSVPEYSMLISLARCDTSTALIVCIAFMCACHSRSLQNFSMCIVHVWLNQRAILKYIRAPFQWTEGKSLMTVDVPIYLKSPAGNSQYQQILSWKYKADACRFSSWPNSFTISGDWAERLPFTSTAWHYYHYLCIWHVIKTAAFKVNFTLKWTPVNVLPLI